MVPLVYLVVAVADVQRSELAVSQAAREAGRAFATSDSAGEAYARARAAVRIALDDQGLPDDAQLRFVPAGASCTGDATDCPGTCPRRAVHGLRGAHRRHAGRAECADRPRVRTVGEYEVHVDDYRVVP